ncbi:MAG: GNAT family N-acetyltransferase [Alphaproteobacteria bacterium]|nr:GNAT family N-acetyltransferase [Alphaproteobacteria bacterium SS10]
MNWTIRILNRTDASDYRALRLEALEQDPAAFGATLEEDQAKSRPWFRRGLHEHTVFGAIDADGSLIASAGFVRGERLKQRHKATIYGLYVAPGHRGKGVARSLLQQLIASAEEQGIEQLQISVVTDNTTAGTLYESLGFEAYGLEPQALKYKDRYYDERHYWLPLT